MLNILIEILFSKLLEIIKATFDFLTMGIFYQIKEGRKLSSLIREEGLTKDDTVYTFNDNWSLGSDYVENKESVCFIDLNESYKTRAVSDYIIYSRTIGNIVSLNFLYLMINIASLVVLIGSFYTFLYSPMSKGDKIVITIGMVFFMILRFFYTVQIIFRFDKKSKWFTLQIDNPISIARTGENVYNTIFLQSYEAREYKYFDFPVKYLRLAILSNYDMVAYKCDINYGDSLFEWFKKSIERGRELYENNPNKKTFEQIVTKYTPYPEGYLPPDSNSIVLEDVEESKKRKKKTTVKRKTKKGVVETIEPEPIEVEEEKDNSSDNNYETFFYG